MRVLRVTAVAALAVTLVGVSTAGSDGASAGASQSLVGPIQLTASSLSITTRVVAPPGRTANATEQVWSLRDRHGWRVGWWVLACRWVSGSDRLCNTVVRMPRGDISVMGVSATPYLGTFSVVGGTGAYDGASGWANFTGTGRGKLILSIQLT